MNDYFMRHPLPLALLGAYFIPFAMVAYAVVACRMMSLKARRAELCLFMLFVVLVAVEYVQLASTGRSFASNADCFGLSRYFGVLAPFLWIFAAKGAAFLWSHPHMAVSRVGKVVLIVALGFLVWKENITEVVNYKTKLNAHDTEVAVANLAPIILDDYTGPIRQRDFKRSHNEYFTGLRPVVACPFGAAGWAVRGDHCQTTGMESPYPEDYLCYPLGSSFAGITNIDVRVYKYIASVPGGLGTKWMLFRRRTTPGKAR